MKRTIREHIYIYKLVQIKKTNLDSNKMKEVDDSLASYNTANQKESMCEDITMTDEETKNSESFLETAIKSCKKTTTARVLEVN